MKRTAKRSISFLILLALTVSLFSGLGLTAAAAEPASAGEVSYYIGNPASSSYKNVVANWGTRGTNATFLTTYAQDYYTGSYSYSTLSALSGTTSTSASSIYSSALGSALHSMLSAKQSSNTSYDATRYLYCYTDCQQNNVSKISSYYSGASVTGTWDSGKTWNREHTWPNSKGLNGNDENDIMMLRPTSVKENSSRSNAAYGESSGYYDPNIGSYNLHGDVARLMLQHMIRWGNTGSMFGSSGVMESRAVLLSWMEEDPVDTWEMGRNDAVQSITGVRNVFVDYPELAFKLLGASVPSGYPTPSGGSSGASYTVTASSNNTSYGTVSVNGYVITATPKTGYYASGYTVTSGTATVTQDGNTFTVSPSSNCSVRINFAAKTAVTLTFSVPDGVTQSSVSGYQGDVITLPTPSGTPAATAHSYTFAGWVTKTVSDTETSPTIYAAGGNWTLNSSMTLYALYTYRTGEGASNDWTLIRTDSDLSVGMELILACSSKNVTAGSVSSSYMSSVTSTFTDSAVVPGDGTQILTLGGQAGAYTFANEAGQLLGSSAAKSVGWGSGQTNWTISITEGTATINNATSTYGKLQYNSSSPRFTTYTSAQTAVQLYGRASGTTYYTTVLSATCTHSWDSGVVTAPTCTAGGYTTYTCTLCGVTKTGNETAATGHKNGSPVSNNNGTHTLTCTVCGSTITYDCTYSTVVTPPTQTAQGYTTYTCTSCGYSYKGNYTDATGVNVTVSFSVPEGVTGIASMTCNSLTGITLPTVSGTPTNDTNSSTFIGWTTSVVDHSATKPVVYAAGSTFTASVNTTLYALYTYGGSSGEPYTIGASGTYVVAAVVDGVYYAMPNTFSSKITAEEITVSGGAVTSANAADYAVTVTASGSDTITISNGSTYLTYSSSTNLGTASGAYNWSIAAADKGSWKITSTASTTRGLIYRADNGVFGGYSTTNVTTSSAYYYVELLPIAGSGSGSATYTTVFTAAAPCQHTNTAVEGAKAATCTETGYTGDTVCQDCGVTVSYGASIPAKGHTEGTPVDNGDGTHSISCTVCNVLLKTEDHAYTGGSCVCGVEAPVTGPVYDANLIFRYNSFTMGSALNVVYIVGAGTTNYADVRAVVTKYNADGTTTEKTYSIADGTMKDSGGISTFTFDGVAAKELGDTFVAKLYATGKDGTEYYGEEKTLSLKSFLLPYTQEADYAKKDLAVALLNYGAAAQVYFNYNYDANDPSTLVNYELTADQKVIDIREASATASVTGDGAKNVYNTVLLESKIVLYAIFNLSDYSSRIGELTAVVTNTETGETVARLPVTAMGTNGSFRFDDVSAKNTRTMFSIAIYDGETKVSQDLQWSVECMVSGCRANASTSQAKLDLANAILAYGDYAAAYLG